MGRKIGFTSQNENFHNVSLGQGQEVVAEGAMDVAAQKGHWVILQNIHLVKKWLPSLEKKLEHFSENSHSDYRVFMSAEPAATPSAHIIPQVRFLKILKFFLVFIGITKKIFNREFWNRR